MILLYSQGGEKQAAAINAEPDRYGSILTPASSRAYLSDCAGVIGVDNGAYAGFDERRFWNLLDFAEGYRALIKFVAAPDVVAGAGATLELFGKWNTIILDYDLPVALVLQDGMISESIPWPEIDAVFVGGSDEYKQSHAVDRIIIEAKRRNKWVHAGRVSTKKRIRHFYLADVDSIDSTAFSRWPRHIGNLTRWVEQWNMQRLLQQVLFEEEECQLQGEAT